jgi:uncharacterized membrane protein YcaP (DUF421 family)
VTAVPPVSTGDRLGIDLATAGDVVIATVAICLTALLLVRVVGQRSLTAMSATDVVCVIALGAVVGRTTLLAIPTLAAGVIAVAVLFALRGLLARAARVRGLGRLLAPGPVVLVRDGRVLADGLRRARVQEDELREQLRLAGVVALDRVGLVVLERTGRLSVLPAGAPIDPWLLSDLDLGRAVGGAHGFDTRPAPRSTTGPDAPSAVQEGRGS